MLMIFFFFKAEKQIVGFEHLFTANSVLYYFQTELHGSFLAS